MAATDGATEVRKRGTSPKPEKKDKEEAPVLVQARKGSARWLLIIAVLAVGITIGAFTPQGTKLARKSVRKITKFADKLLDDEVQEAPKDGLGSDMMQLKLEGLYRMMGMNSSAMPAKSDEELLEEINHPEKHMKKLKKQQKDKRNKSKAPFIDRLSAKLSKKMANVSMAQVGIAYLVVILTGVVAGYGLGGCGSPPKKPVKAAAKQE